MVSYQFVEYILKEGDEKPEDETIFDILLWAIFSNRKELAEICWLRVENHLCMCHNIFQKRLLYSAFSKKSTNFFIIKYCVSLETPHKSFKH